MQAWKNTKRRLQPDAIFQMARRLRLDPKKFGGFNGLKKEPWEGILPDFIIALYEKRFGKRGS